MAESNFDIDLLRVFVTVVEMDGFTRAGKRLHRTQATISLQIKRLEQMIERRLFERRQGRLIGLTESGESLLSYARQILRINDEALLAVTEPELEGTVRLGTPEDFASRYLPLILAKFAQMHPRVRLEVRCDLSANLLSAVRCGMLDIVLVKREVGGDTGISVCQEPLMWVGSVAYPITDMATTLPLAVFPEGCAYRTRALDVLEAQGRQWRVTYTSSSLTGIQAAVLGGLGISVLPKSALLPGHKVLNGEIGFPVLPDIELALHVASRGQTKVWDRLIEYILERVKAGLPPMSSWH